MTSNCAEATKNALRPTPAPLPKKNSEFILFGQDVCEAFLPAGGSIETVIGGGGGCVDADGGAIAAALCVCCSSGHGHKENLHFIDFVANYHSLCGIYS